MRLPVTSWNIKTPSFLFLYDTLSVSFPLSPNAVYNKRAQNLRPRTMFNISLVFLILLPYPFPALPLFLSVYKFFLYLKSVFLSHYLPCMNGFYIFVSGLQHSLSCLPDTAQRTLSYYAPSPLRLQLKNLLLLLFIIWIQKKVISNSLKL